MLIEERANENREMASRFMRFKCITKENGSINFINLLRKGLTQEINGDGGSI